MSQLDPEPIRGSMSQLDPEPIRVFLVDHNPRVRRALRALLEATPGFAVVGEAASATNGEVLHGQHGASLILLDLMAPDVHDGLALVARLAVETDRVVIATSTRSGLRDAALQAGAWGFLDQGETPDGILTLLRRAMPPVHRPRQSEG